MPKPSRAAATSSSPSLNTGPRPGVTVTARPSRSNAQGDSSPMEGLTHTEIATRLSVTRQTVITDIADVVAELAEGLGRADGRRK